MAWAPAPARQPPHLLSQWIRVLCMDHWPRPLGRHLTPSMSWLPTVEQKASPLPTAVPSPLLRRPHSRHTSGLRAQVGYSHSLTAFHNFMF